MGHERVEGPRPGSAARLESRAVGRPPARGLDHVAEAQLADLPLAAQPEDDLAGLLEGALGLSCAGGLEVLDLALEAAPRAGQLQNPRVCCFEQLAQQRAGGQGVAGALSGGGLEPAQAQAGVDGLERLALLLNVARLSLEAEQLLARRLEPRARVARRANSRGEVELAPERDDLAPADQLDAKAARLGLRAQAPDYQLARSARELCGEGQGSRDQGSAGVHADPLNEAGARQAGRHGASDRP